MFIGEYHHSIDEKKRIIIPSKFRYELGEKFVITRGIEHCLFAYSLEEWQKITDKLNSLPFTKKDARNFIRFFLSGATEAELDKQGRTTITTPQLNYAQIEKECIVIGAGSRIEIWSDALWNAFFDEASEDMSEIAENLFNGDVNL